MPLRFSEIQHARTVDMAGEPFISIQPPAAQYNRPTPDITSTSHTSDVKTTGEPLLEENKHRFVLFPINHDEIWDFYKKAQASFWIAEELDLSPDLVDWEQKLNDNERFFISRVLAFFAASDGIVNENLACRFMNEVQVSQL